MKKSDLEKLLFELAKSTCNYRDIETQKCINNILSSDINKKYKELIKESFEVDRKPIQIVTDFDKRTQSEIEVIPFKVACGNEVPIFTIKDMRDLIQFVGYCKYTNASTYNVYMRGQTNLYGGKMIPTLYRGQNNLTSTLYGFRKRLNLSVKELKILKNYDKRIVEPMIQHYGIKTTNIDLVDNVWVALWFGLHTARSVISGGRENVYYSKSNEEYAYLIMMATDAVHEQSRGIREGEHTRLVDLRKAVPSYFVRTHAQHALMLKKKEMDIDNVTEADVDYSDLIVGIARIPVSLGLEWIGDNKLLSVGNLFPSAYFDYGYRKMIDQYPLHDKSCSINWGTIQIIND